MVNGCPNTVCVNALRPAKAGCRADSPACGARYDCAAGGSPVTPSRIPPCSNSLEFSPSSIRLSTLTCGTQFHRLPEYANAGVANDAKEVGVCGAKNNPSCPPTIEVRSQSI